MEDKWHEWDDPLTIKAERKDGSSAITIDNGVYGETFKLRGKIARLSGFQIQESRIVPMALVGRGQTEDNSGIANEWVGIIDRLTD